MTIVSGFATPAGTAAYASRFPPLVGAGHFRNSVPEGLQVASLGAGTYLGEADNAGDQGYEAALRAALDGGLNLIDTAINYRHQRSERVIGRVVAGYAREELLICSKAGFLPFDHELQPDPRRYLTETYVTTGLAPREEIAGGSHCMAPGYLRDQLARSRRNLGLRTLDVFYLHNPETQAAELAPTVFEDRMRRAFQALEEAVAADYIRAYGVATWNGFRADPAESGYLSLRHLLALATEVGGAGHHFRFIQLPFNLGMPEAALRPNQPVEGPGDLRSVFEAATVFEMNVVVSASLGNGRLVHLPEELRGYLRLQFPQLSGDPALALQFARSAPGVLTALVGMAKTAHVAENLRLIAQPPATPDVMARLVAP